MAADSDTRDSSGDEPSQDIDEVTVEFLDEAEIRCGISLGGTQTDDDS